ncbi:uncharacterized protein BX663DRAFT_462811 [Cokeromyces recurvatus]|uniref:uncharacterized protein n=1 Tax=Cokeromyces recurvatus TaxID=90255 RepID=UPI00221E606B|nr:uncharacterized protein BX663DRAFT_462811 [Cokeromyces recurvatus]KAI7897884.1 hypothetical protein BX663DRAFT_462811 [Cokeromyces recurvatus]
MMNTTQPIHIFHIPKSLLDRLEPVEKDNEVLVSLQQEEDVTAKALERLQIQQDKLNNESNNAFICNTCTISFTDRNEQRNHFNTDWHRYNIKRRIVLNVEPVSLEAFEVLIADLTESISGSDDSEEEENGDSESLNRRDQVRSTNINSLVDKQKEEQENQEELENSAKQVMLPIMKKYSALTWFKTTDDDYHYGVYRHLFSIPQTTLQSLQQPKRRIWTIIMVGGGHFAGAVIDANSADKVHMLAHRTFHRYTTRRKQGGSQSANDNAKGAANSAGAMIRRHNELMLQQEVREVLAQWQSHIKASEFVFVHAPSSNRKSVFHYEGAVLDPEHVKSIPFATRRPTLNELQRVYKELTTMKVVRIDKEAADAYRQKWMEREERLKRQLEKSTMVKKEINHNTADKMTVNPQLEKLLALIKQNKTAVILGYLEKNNMHLPLTGALPKDELDGKEDLYHYPTLLHLAASVGGREIVMELLVTYDADPTIVSAAGKTAYEVSKDRETRNAFRRCMCDFPDKWEWLEKGRVPSPLTKEQEEQQREKEKKKQAREEEKRRLIEIERRKIEAAKEAKEEERRLEKLQAQRAKRNLLPIVQTLGGDSVANTANMSPEARMRLEREKRARAAEERMKRFNNK